MAQSAALVTLGVTMVSLSLAVAGGIHYLDGVLDETEHHDENYRSA